MSKEQKHKTSLYIDKVNMGLVYYLISQNEQASLGDYINTLLDGMRGYHAERRHMSIEEFNSECWKAYSVRNVEKEPTYITKQNIQKVMKEKEKEIVYTEDNIPAGSLEKNFM